MNETDYDVIIIGAGCAGSIAAYVAASAGKSVLLVERGISAGSKNMTGGRIYSHALLDVFPDFETEAPLERRVSHERVSMMDPKSSLTLDFSSDQLLEKGQNSYSVLRGPFDAWLVGKAEGAGALCILGIPVDHLLKSPEGKVTGVVAGDDEITAHVTIVADGANSLLAKEATGANTPTAVEIAVGVKEVLSLPARDISSRFNVDDDDGAAWLFVGDCTHGHTGGGFLYTNKDSISLGLVATISDLMCSDTSICKMLDDFKKHPLIAPVIKGSTLLEHSGHMVPEGGYDSIPKLHSDGVLVAGDAAMLCMNLGYMVRGMDLAVASGRIAAEAAVKAIDAGDVSETALKAYREGLENSFVLRDMASVRKWPSFMAGCNRLFVEYPRLVANMFNTMYVVDGTPKRPLKKEALSLVKEEVGVGKVVKDMRGALGAL